MSARAAVAAVAGSATPVSLPEVLARAELQQRFDRKYLIPVGTFRRWMSVVGEELDVLDIAGSRQFSYESWYFDTPDLMTYREHRQERRRRYKVRTRSYLDSEDCCFEVKLEGWRGSTIKERTGHPIARRDRITATAWRLMRSALVDNRLPIPSGLEPTLRTGYLRTTLLSRRRPVRITCDVDLVCETEAARALGPHDRVLVEVKSPRENDPVDRHLSQLGIRPEKISKYCVGIALLHPELTSNPWHPVLKRHFGWRPQSPTPPAHN